MVADRGGLKLNLLDIIDAATELPSVTLPLEALAVLRFGQYCDGFNHANAILSRNS